MQRVVIVNGLKRSGNHSIINWMLPQSSFLFFNNILPLAPLLEGTKSFPEPVDFEVWKRRQSRRSQISHDSSNTRDLILSLEDHDLTLRFFSSMPPNTTSVLVLREAENLFASRIRKAFSIEHPAYPREHNHVITRAKELWKQHAREFLGITSILSNKVCISYDRWFSSVSYRKRISSELRISYTDQNFSLVPETGGGSSFDHSRFDRQNESMNVLNRKSDLGGAETELLAQIMNDDELRELNNGLIQLLNDHNIRQ